MKNIISATLNFKGHFIYKATNVKFEDLIMN